MIELVIASPPDRELVVAELWRENVQVGEVSNEDGKLRIEIYSAPGTNKVIIPVSELEEALWRARRNLTSRYGEQSTRESSKNYANAGENVLHDVVVELLAKASAAKRQAGSSDSDFDKGRHFGLHESVSLISQQARVYGLSFEEFGLGSVDEERELP